MATITWKINGSSGDDLVVSFDDGSTNPPFIRFNNTTDTFQWSSNGTTVNELADIATDTTPQLGGNLDVQTHSITTSTSNGDITLTPNGTGKVLISGPLQVDGTTTTVNSTTVTVDDPVITLGGDTAPSSDDNKDRGVEFRYHTGSAAKVGFFGYDDSTGRLTYIPDATNSSEVFSGSTGDLDINKLYASNIDAVTLDGKLTAGSSEIEGSNFDIDGGDIASGVTINKSPVITLGGDLSGNVTLTELGNGTLNASIVGGVIVDADVNASAAIAQSKLSLAITTSEIAAGTLVVETEGIGNNDNDTTIPTSAAVKAYVDTNVTAQDLDFTTSSGSGSVDLDSQALAFTPGEGVDITHSGQAVTIAGEDATTSNKGIASFNSADFSVSSGSVSLADLTVSHIAASTLVIGSEGIANNDNDTTLPTSAAVKAYVDTRILTEDTIEELNDTNIGSLAAGHVLIWDGTDTWDNKALTGDVTVGSDGTTAIGSEVIVNADIDASAAIAQSKLSLAITTSELAAGTLVIETEGIGSNDNDTTIPTSAAVKDYVDTAITAEDLDFSTDSGSGAVDLNSQTLAFTSGEGLDITHSGQAVTFAVEDATSHNKGIASFASADFSVSSGVVTLVDLTTSHIASATLVTESDGIGSNDNDTTLPTSAAVKNYVDTNAEVSSDSSPQLGGNLDVLTHSITTSTSNGNVTLTPNGTGKVVISGDLQVDGTTTTVNSTTVTVDDPILTLGGDSAPSSDDNKDRGIEYRYHTGSAAKVGFFGLDDSTGRFTFIPDATNSSEVFSGTTGDVDINKLHTSNISAFTLDGKLTAGSNEIEGSNFDIDGGDIASGVTINKSPVITLGGDLTGNVTLTELGNGTLTAAIASGVIVDADVNASAAIAQSKLSLAITTSEIAAGTLVIESEGIGSNDNDTTIPTSAAVKDYVDTNITAQDLDFSTDSGSGAVDLDSQTLALTSGEGIDITHSGQAVTIAAEEASAHNKGIASFASGDFSVSSGAVSLADLTVSHLAAATLVTESEGISSNDNDTTLPTSAAVKDYVDSNSGNAFTTMAVSGQSNVVADAISDTLTFVAGSNITITTDASGDSITINSTASSSVSAFTDLSDVGATTATAGRIMVADGDSWESVAVSGDASLASSGALTIANDAVTLAKMAGLARGKIIYGDASGDPAALAVGTNGYVLTSDGTDISWAEAAGGQAYTGATSAPSSPSAGDEWYDTNNAILYKRVVDSSSNAVWLDISGSSSAGGLISTQETTSIGTSATTIQEFGKSLYQSAKVVVEVTDVTNTEYRVSEVLILHDGSNAHIVEYGVAYTGSSDFATLTADISGANVRLRCVGTSANNTAKVVWTKVTA